MRLLVVMACLVITASGCAANSRATTTTVFDLFGLDCPTDRFESVVNDFGAVTGPATAQDALAEFFEVEGRRFSALEPTESAVGDLAYAFVDSDGSVELSVQLTDEYGGYLVAGYSYCVDGN